MRRHQALFPASKSPLPAVELAERSVQQVGGLEHSIEGLQRITRRAYEGDEHVVVLHPPDVTQPLPVVCLATPVVRPVRLANHLVEVLHRWQVRPLVAEQLPVSPVRRAALKDVQDVVWGHEARRHLESVGGLRIGHAASVWTAACAMQPLRENG